MSGKSGKSLALILAGMPKPGGAPMGPAGAPPPEDSAPGGDLETAAQDVLDAIKAGDAQALAGALQSFVTMADKD